MKDKRLISVIVGLVFFIPALLTDKINGTFAAYLTLYALAWAAAAWSVAYKAARNISRGIIFDENFLMLIASVGAFVINIVFSDYETELNAPGGGEASTIVEPLGHRRLRLLRQGALPVSSLEEAGFTLLTNSSKDQA